MAHVIKTLSMMKIETVQAMIKSLRESGLKRDASDYKCLREAERLLFVLAFIMLLSMFVLTSVFSGNRHMPTWIIVVIALITGGFGIAAIAQSYRYKIACSYFEKYAPQTVDDLKSKMAQLNTRE